MFGLFRKKEKPAVPVVLDLRDEYKPDGWDDLIRLGFEPVFVNPEPRPNKLSGDYVQTRWRLKANPEVTCCVSEKWEGGAGATFIDFDAPWSPSRMNAPYYVHWPWYELKSLPRLESVLIEGVRGESEPLDPNRLDLRQIAMPDPVRMKLLELGFERDDTGSMNWAKNSRWYGPDPVLRAHIDERAETVTVVDVETENRATVSFEDFLKLDRIEYGRRKTFSKNQEGNQ